MSTTTIGVSLSWNDESLIRGLRNGQERIGYIVVGAINDTLKRAQTNIETHVADVFQIRERGQSLLLNRGGGHGLAAVIRKSDFASAKAGRAYGEIAVGTTSQGAELLLSMFEQGGERRPFVGKNQAVPVIGGPARPSWGQNVPAAFSIKSLSIVKVRAGVVQKTAKGRARRERVRGLGFHKHITGSGAVQFKGALRTFILLKTGSHPLGGVYQRVGPGRDDIRMVYSFRPPERLDTRLRFVSIVQQTVDTWFAEAVQQRIVDAIQWDAKR